MRSQNRNEAARNEPGGPYAIFCAMIGREPDRGVRERIEKVRAALNARDDDAIWIVLAIFESAIDRTHRAYRLYVRCLLLAVCLEIAVQITSLCVTEGRLRSDDTEMRTAIVNAIRLAACGGIGEPDMCEIARRNAATPARRALSDIVSRLPDDLAYKLASTQNINQWLAWMVESAAVKAAPGSPDARKAGRLPDGH